MQGRGTRPIPRALGLFRPRPAVGSGIAARGISRSHQLTKALDREDRKETPRRSRRDL